MHFSSLFPSKFSAVFKKMANGIADQDRPKLNANGDMDCFSLMRSQAQTLAERPNASLNTSKISQGSSPKDAPVTHPQERPRELVVGAASAKDPVAPKVAHPPKNQELVVTHQPDFFGFSLDLVHKNK